MQQGFDEYAIAWHQRFRRADEERRRRAEAARALLPRLVERLVSAWGARRVILWGSLSAGGFRETSDVDIVVEGLPPGRELFRALAELQDLAPGFCIDLIPWEDADQQVRAAVEEAGEVLYERQSP